MTSFTDVSAVTRKSKGILFYAGDIHNLLAKNLAALKCRVKCCLPRLQGVMVYLWGQACARV